MTDPRKYARSEGKALGIDAGDAEIDSLDAQSITDTNDGAPWETLREIGFETGDVIPVANIGPDTNSADSTTSNTFSTAYNIIQASVDWRSYLLANVDSLKVRLSAHVTINDDELFVRAYNVDEGEPIAPAISTTTAYTAIGSDQWYDYTPPSSSNRVRGQIRNSDNTNTVEVRSLTLHIGYEI